MIFALVEIVVKVFIVDGAPVSLMQKQANMCGSQLQFSKRTSIAQSHFENGKPYKRAFHLDYIHQHTSSINMMRKNI